MAISTLCGLIGSNVSSQEAIAVLSGFQNLQSSVVDLAADEGQSPEYFLSDRLAGIQIRHSEAGEIEDIYLFSEGKDRFAQFKGELCGGLTFSSTARQVKLVFGEPQWSRPPREIPVFGAIGESLKYWLENCTVHFQFRVAGDGILQITLSANTQ